MTYLVKNRLWNDIDQAFDNFFSAPAVARTKPAVNIWEDANGYNLEAELPGMSEKDLNVTVKENLLTVSSRKSEEKTVNDENDEKSVSKNNDDVRYLMRERRDLSFERSFVLPKDADANKIKASFNNGLLKLEIAKVPEASPKTIKIN